MVKVSVIITAHNYEKYLRQCIDSVLNQTYQDFEIIVVDDGSTDNTQRIIKDYERDNPQRIKSIKLNGNGLPVACNNGIEIANGEYIIRLDADDFFDENILLILANFLDQRPGIGMVYPDYYRVHEDGSIVDHVRLMKANYEMKLLDRSPLGAGAMYRKKCWSRLDGYNENLECQEDYDFWIRFISRFKVHNINLPLMYYRQHGNSLSKNTKKMMAAMKHVKEEFISKHMKSDLEKMKIVAFIPSKAASWYTGGILSLRELGGKSMIRRTIEEAKKTGLFDRIIISTESKEIAEEGKKYGAEVPFMRPAEFSLPSAGVGDAISYALKRLENDEGYKPDIVVTIHTVSPMLKSEHIKEAIHTHMIFNTDSVISVYNNLKFHWNPGRNGLTPLFEKRLLKKDMETLYEENGALIVTRPELIKQCTIGNKIGHILMTIMDSIRIDSEDEFMIAEHILKMNGEPA